MARARDGAFVVVWDGESMDADIGVVAREFTKSGKPIGGQFLVNVETAGVQAASDVGISSTGFAVVWADQEGTSGVNDDIYVRRYLRRVVFTDDFESGDDGYWAAAVP